MNRLRRFALTSLTALAIGFGESKSLEAATLRVPSEYSTIQQAVNSSSNGDEILVAPGIYRENIRISNKSITIRSESGYQNTELSQTPGTAPAPIIDISNEDNLNFKIQGFTINAYNQQYVPGINDNSSTSHGEITDNLIENTWSAVEGANGAKLHVHNNIIKNNRIGMEGNSLEVDFNVISIDSSSPYFGGGIGVVYGSQSNAPVRNNTIVGYDWGLYGGNIKFSNNIIAYGNVIGNPDTGILLDEGNNLLFRLSAGNICGPMGCEKSGCPDLTEDPLFCDMPNGNFYVHSNSVCLPENNSCHELIGALGNGCESTPVNKTSWGKLKTIYR